VPPRLFVFTPKCRDIVLEARMYARPQEHMGKNVHAQIFKNTRTKLACAKEHHFDLFYQYSSQSQPCFRSRNTRKLYYGSCWSRTIP